MSNSDSTKVMKFSLGCMIAIACLYIFQGAFIHFRLLELDAVKETLKQEYEQCDELNCNAAWTFRPQQTFLLLGHILRTHKLIREKDGIEILPITQVRGTVADAWVRLRVYQVTPHAKYKLIATKPTSTRLDYFMGILPRTTDQPGILSVPEVGPTISMITGMLSTFFLMSIFAASFIGRGQIGAGSSDKHKMLFIFLISALMLTFSGFVSLGVIDTLLPDGEIRNKLLRIPIVIGMILLLVSRTAFIFKTFFKIKIFALVILIAVMGLWSWPYLRGGQSWAIVLAIVSILGSYLLVKHNQYLAAAVWGSALLDSLKIMNFFQTPDYPPIYLFNVMSVLALTLVAGKNGGFSTIAMASDAYLRFRRELVLSSLQSAIQKEDSAQSSDKIYALKDILPSLASLTHSGRVAITVNLPLGRPIILNFDRDTGETNIFDDGTIPGVVTLRTLLYGDTAIFEPFALFAKRLNILFSPRISDAKYFCGLPLVINNTIIGALTLTKFNDSYIERQITKADGLSYERETLKLLAESLSQNLSKLMVQDLNKSATISKQLHNAIHEEIANSESTEDFLKRFLMCVSKICNVQVMIHEQIETKGVGIAQSQIPPSAWQFFIYNPLNLAPDAAGALGPTVVGFRDKKSSYIKDVKEIMNRLHAKTQIVLELMDTQCMAVVPLRTQSRSFVVTMFTTRDQGPADPSINSVIESTEALFVAAIEVMSQKTSVLALGQLASRLIGDVDVREKILDAAKSSELPTTVGSARTSFLLLFDLAGSSDLSHDTELKARAYGQFYDAVNKKSQELLNGIIRKTIGDAVIVTWDGSRVDLAMEDNFLQKLEHLTKYADTIARSIGCKGARAVLHHGSYFLGLVGTQTFGQIDVIGSGIDEVCKMEGLMKGIKISGKPIKLAISENAVNNLPSIMQDDYEIRKYRNISDLTLSKMNIHFVRTLCNDDEVNNYVA